MDRDMNEEVNKIKDTIEDCFKEFNLLKNEKNEKVYELCIKLGDLLQLNGDIDKSLKYYKIAYDTALFLDNKTWQVDSLDKIVQNYIINGEIEKCIKLVEKADNLLKGMNYIEGKLKISLCWIKIYYYQNRYYEAREIGNEAISLCGDKFLIYKGRILNSLAIMYSEFISNDEHLNMLEEALECFEKMNYSRGILGIINNIAEVYADKIQNNDKALEYYLKLKNGSENYGYKELSGFAHANIGEIYYKRFRYEDALFYFKDALKIAKEASVRNMILYSYSFIVSIYIQLNDYNMAYNYYTQAAEEVLNYPHQGTNLAVYHKAVSKLFLEFGQIEKAKSDIKKALDIVRNVESVVRWSMEFDYELIRLRASKNKSEILDVIRSIRFILAKHKNPDAILNIVYDLTMELMDSGNNQLAYEFFDNYKAIKSEHKRLKAKYEYIEGNRSEIDESYRLKSLKSALKLAEDTKNFKLSWKLLSNIGDLYFEKNNPDKAVSYYYDACKNVKELMNNVPFEFRTEFAKFQHMDKLFEKVANLKDIHRKLDDNRIFDSINNGEIFKKSLKCI